MSRRIFLTTALDRLVDQGTIGRRSNAHRIIKIVIEGGVTALEEEEREIYDRDLIPKIEDVQLGGKVAKARTSKITKVVRRPTSH